MKISRPSSKSHSAGFTLLELLVIVVMVGVLAAIVAPSWLGFLNRQRVATVRSDLLQTIKQTQQDAIQRRQTVTVTIEEDEDVPTINTGIDRNLGENSGIKPGTISLDSYYIDASGEKQERTQISFDYQGRLVHINGDEEEVPPDLPFIISVEGGNAKQCVIMASLIGSIKTAKGTTCDDPTVEPVEPS
jgi:type II secretory pathway pseudopilin PulG